MFFRASFSAVNKERQKHDSNSDKLDKDLQAVFESGTTKFHQIKGFSKLEAPVT